MAYLPIQLRSMILTYFTGFNLFKVDNSLVDDSIWQHRIGIEYEQLPTTITSYRDYYIKLLANKQIISCDIVKSFIDLAINFSDVDLVYSLLNNFHVMADADLLHGLGIKLIYFNKITMFNKLVNLLSVFRYDLLLGALAIACIKADTSLIDMLIKSGADDSNLLILTTTLENFIKIEQTYKKQPTDRELDFAIEHGANGIAIYLIDKGLYSNKVLVFLTNQNDLTRLQKISNLIKNDYNSRCHLVSALVVADSNGYIPIIEFLLMVDTDFSIIIDYIFIKYKIVNTMLDNTIEQICDSKFRQNTLNLIKQQILATITDNKDLVVITKLKQLNKNI